MAKFFLDRPYIMGIVNVTPDSFSDGGQFLGPEQAITHGLRLLKDGADILDIGGESTRPGAQPVSIEEELSRVIPVIEGLKDQAKWISIDTRHAAIMRAAVMAGANFINDVSALEDDPESISVCAEFMHPICLMHKQGQPDNMQDNPTYKDVVQEVYEYFEKRIQACADGGIDKSCLILDVGIGFGKTLEQNLLLLKNIDKFHDLGLPIMLGASRKSFIEKAMGFNVPAQNRLGGSLTSVLWCLDRGVHIFRVHDVYETCQAIKIFEEVRMA